MRFNRIDAKLQAKESMRTAYPHPMLITLVFLLTTSVLTVVIQRFVTNPYMIAFRYLEQGYGVEEVVRYVFTGGRMFLFFLLVILLSLYTAVMNFGYTSYSLRMARNEQPSYRNLLDGFSMLAKVVGMTLLVGLRVLLWELIGLVPYLVFFGAFAFTGMIALFWVGLVFLLAGIALGVLAAYRYRLSTYFLLDYPNMGVVESIYRSSMAMKGWKGELFMLDLSFIGWAVLTPFTLGILSLWLTPYRNASQANFYDAVAGTREQDQEGQQDRLNPGSGPEDGFHKVDF